MLPSWQLAWLFFSYRKSCHCKANKNALVSPFEEKKEELLRGRGRGDAQEEMGGSTEGGNWTKKLKKKGMGKGRTRKGEESQEG